jgi:hypothetical protein
MQFDMAHETQVFEERVIEALQVVHMLFPVHKVQPVIEQL